MCRFVVTERGIFLHPSESDYSTTMCKLDPTFHLEGYILYDWLTLKLLKEIRCGKKYMKPVYNTNSTNIYY